MCCEQLRFLLHERFVFEADGLLCQPLTARWISRSWVSAQSLGSWTIGDQRSHVSTAEPLSAQAILVTEVFHPPETSSSSPSACRVTACCTPMDRPPDVLVSVTVRTHVKPAVDALRDASYAMKLSCQVSKPANGIHIVGVFSDGYGNHHNATP